MRADCSSTANEPKIMTSILLQSKSTCKTRQMAAKINNNIISNWYVCCAQYIYSFCQDYYLIRTYSPQRNIFYEYVRNNIFVKTKIFHTLWYNMYISSLSLSKSRDILSLSLDCYTIEKLHVNLPSRQYYKLSQPRLYHYGRRWE